MSVQTQADERLERARANLTACIEELTPIVFLRCPGWDEYKPIFLEAMRLALNDLAKVREALQ